MQVAGLLYAQECPRLSGALLRVAGSLVRARPSSCSCFCSTSICAHLLQGSFFTRTSNHVETLRPCVQLYFDGVILSLGKKHIFGVGVSFECLGHGTQDRIVERCKAPPSALAWSCREVVGGQSGRGSGQTKARCWRSLLPAAARVARAPKKVQNLAKN